MFQGDSKLVAFQDKLGICYVTSLVASIQVLVSHSFLVERLEDQVVQLRDSWADELRGLTWGLVYELTLKRLPIVFYPFIKVVPNAKPNESTYDKHTSTLMPKGKSQNLPF